MSLCVWYGVSVLCESMHMCVCVCICVCDCVCMCACICMDACMIDVTDTDAQEGDPVIVFDEELPVNELSDKLKTIPYEILTSVSPRVKRVYYRE